MSIDGISVLKAATGITITGGSASVWESDGAKIDNGIHIVDTSESNFIVRKHATFKSRSPVLANGLYSKGKRDVTIVAPKILLDGSVSFPLYRGSFEFHPEMTAAERLELKMLAVQSIMDSETDNFYTFGSVK